ncbi:MAG: HNH endonuclease [Gemmatimonadetes bacterium]|nr:HNH endonuclease [Gemmatimonadota bacterium]
MPSVSRRKFIESLGATCENWTWSWSFINHEERTVIFGAWTHRTNGDTCLILDDDWRVRRGRRQPGYTQAREHLRLVEEERYQLMTFPMTRADRSEGSDAGPASISSFVPKLTAKRLVRAGTQWYGAGDEIPPQVPEELPGQPEEFVEGAAVSVSVNAYERSGRARAECLRHHGYSCAVCGFDFERAYGALGRGFIHVHHVVSLSAIRRAYVVDPITDLIPVCPNCHALIHRTQPAQTIEALRSQLASQASFAWPLL